MIYNKKKTTTTTKILYKNPAQTPFDALFSSTKRFNGLLNHYAIMTNSTVGEPFMPQKNCHVQISYFDANLNFIQSRDYQKSSNSFGQRFSEGRFTVAADNYIGAYRVIRWRGEFPGLNCFLYRKTLSSIRGFHSTTIEFSDGKCVICCSELRDAIAGSMGSREMSATLKTWVWKLAR